MQWNQKKKKGINLRVPSKRVAIVSKKVFWGASSPFLAGIGGSVKRGYLNDPENINLNVRKERKKYKQHEIKFHLTIEYSKQYIILY